MSAASRLWRRAPAWRLSLLSAVALTGLAAMFPPALPMLHWPWRAGALSGPNQASFHAQPQPSVSTTGAWHMMPPGTAKAGIVSEAGRQLPLPAGDWQELGVGTVPGSSQQIMFDRVVANHLTGLLLGVGTGPLGGEAGPVGLPPQCNDPERLAGMIVPAEPGQSPLAHECWEMTPIDMHAMASGQGNPLLKPALGVLGKLGIEVPSKMLALTFFRSTDSAWRWVTFMVPDTGGRITSLRNWAANYNDLLKKGFDGTATSADLTKAATRDPS